jgi:SAM-dependent methyltransferase
MVFADASAYDRFMGRWSGPLARTTVERLDWDGVQRVLDVGCGPGALTGALVRQLGAGAVTAVDPSEPFVAAVRARHPGVDAHRSSAEHLPFGDGGYDVVLAQLVVHFMSDPVAGLREMLRVGRPGALVGASVWDHPGGRGPLSPYWRAAAQVDGGTEDHLPGAREGHLVQLLTEAGADGVQGDELAVELSFESFESWWEPFTLGVGTAGDHLAALDETARHELEEHCRAELGDGPFTCSSVAWWAQGVVPA